MTKPTRNTQNPSISFIEANKDNNLQAVCEAVFGNSPTQGQGTWTAATELTITDDRVSSNSRIILTPAVNAPVGVWYVKTLSSGSFVIGSSETELAGTKVNYLVINNN